VQDGNASHWWIATQDKALQSDLNALTTPIPILFASANGLHLADPSTQAKATVDAGHREDRAVPAHERRTDALKDLAQLRPKDESYKKFRRKKTKGPNPLAIRKKKSMKVGREAGSAGGTLGGDGAAAAAGVSGDAAAVAAAAVRKRKRRKQKEVSNSHQAEM
jgi:U3 small nucleolar RNA-associated protein 23